MQALCHARTAGGFASGHDSCNRGVHARPSYELHLDVLVSPDFREELTAVRQIAQLGFEPRDVRHIALTHLDFDHAGGLDDFPTATVHLLASERDAAFARKTWLDQ